MYVKNILFLVFLTYGLPNVLCNTQMRIPCTLDDYKCTTKAADPVYKIIVNGIPNIGVPPSDPIYQEVIFGFVRDMNYTLTDAYLYGMKNCSVTHHRIFAQQLRWTFTLHCPRLIMQSNYDIIGLIGGNHIEGKGICQITDDQYHMVLSGGFEFFQGVDGKSHMRVTSYDFDHLEVLGNVKYELHNLYYGDEVKSQKMHEYLNKNWKTVSSNTHYPTLYAFMGKLLENLNIFLFAVPGDEIFYNNA